MVNRMHLYGGVLGVALLLALLPSWALSQTAADLNSMSPPLWFEANEGQFDSEARFQARGPGYMMRFLSEGPTLGLLSADGNRAQVAIRFQGGSASPRMEGVSPLGGRVNYFLGNEPSEWKVGVPTWEKVAYRSVYPGIDVLFYGQGRDLEYDFELAAGADPGQIRLSFDGADRLSVTADGKLSIELSGGEIHFAAPVAFQPIDGRRIPVDSAYKLLGDGAATFELGSYDPSHPLTIDPLLVYSTYLGGSEGDWARDIVTDYDGWAYVIGTTYTSDIPTSPGGPFLPEPTFTPSGVRGQAGALSDIFVAAIQPPMGPDHAAVRWVTYLGHPDGLDEGTGIDRDSFGNLYLVGTTESPEFPLVSPAQDGLKGISDAVAMVLTPDGDALLLSTYWGGEGTERGMSVSTDGSGRFVISGATSSEDFPLRLPIQDTFGGGGLDSFLTVFGFGGGEGGTMVPFSTFLGGSGDEAGHAVDWLVEADMAVTGITSSEDFPLGSAWQETFGGGPSDAFITVLSGSFETTPTVEMSTFLGGEGPDEGNGVALSYGGEVCVTGATSSPESFPQSMELQSGYGGGLSDAFVTCVYYQGGEPFVPFSTFLGGAEEDLGNDLLYNGSDLALVGTTSSPDFPTVDPIFSFLSGPSDAFVSVMYWGEGSDLSFSTFYGGGSAEAGLGIAPGGSSSYLICGQTVSTNLPLVNEAQDTLLGIEDGFVAEIDPYAEGPPPPPIDPCEEPTIVLFHDDVETSPVSNWTMTGLWHHQTDTTCIVPPAASGNSAFAFNIEGQCTYAQGEGVPFGQLDMVDPILLPDSPCIQLVYNDWVETEDYSGYDTYSVFVSVDGGPFTLLSRDYRTDAEWNEERVDLTSFAGQSIRIRFEFDSGDGSFDDYIGWYIDDIRIVATEGDPGKPPEFVSAFIVNSPGRAYVVFRDEFERPASSYVVTVLRSGVPPVPFYSQTFNLTRGTRAPAGPDSNLFTDVFSLPLKDIGDPRTFEGMYLYEIRGHEGADGTGDVVFVETGGAEVPSTGVDQVTATRNEDDTWTIRFRDSRPTGSGEHYDYYLFEQSFFTSRSERAIQTPLLITNNGRVSVTVDDVGTLLEFQHTYQPTAGNKGWYVRSLKRYFSNNGENLGLSDIGFISPYVHGTIPFAGGALDADGDGFSDELELTIGSSPEDPKDIPSFGDFNGDGHVNLMDAIGLARATTGGALRPYDPYFDINSDGRVDSSDADVLMKWALGVPGHGPLPAR